MDNAIDSVINERIDDLVLHGCWRSSASHRLQIALRLKQLPFRYVPVNLDAGEQHSTAYRAINPHGELPTLVVNGEPWFQSLSILEELELRHPGRGVSLLPADPHQRRRCRELAEAINSSLQPLLLPARLRRPILAAAPEQGRAEHERAIEAGVRAYQGAALEQLERFLADQVGPFYCGNAPTLADVLLVCHLEAALRLGIDLNPCPRLRAVYDACMALPAFAEAAPARMVDAPQDAGVNLVQRSQTLAHKEPAAELLHYLSGVANRPIPGLAFCREQTFAQFGMVASKMTATDACLLLRWLCRSRGVRRALEIGVFTGSSSLALLDGLHPDGELVAIDCDSRTSAIAERCWQEIGQRQRVDLRIGDARELMATLPPGFELISIDAENTQYGRYLELALPLLAPGGLIVLDNVLWRGRVTQPQGDSSAEALDRLIRDLKERPDLLTTVLRCGDGVALVERLQPAALAAAR